MAFVDLCGSLWFFVDLCGSLWFFVDLCGSLWTFVDLCGSLWLACFQPSDQCENQATYHVRPLRRRHGVRIVIGAPHLAFETHPSGISLLFGWNAWPTTSPLVCPSASMLCRLRLATTAFALMARPTMCFSTLDTTKVASSILRVEHLPEPVASTQEGRGSSQIPTCRSRESNSTRCDCR